MSMDLPRAGATSDWRQELTAAARAAASRISVKERARNPMVPDNFMDLTDAGFPADIIVLPIQIPRQGVPQEMGQYRDMLNLQWLHVPWAAISSNGGQDGKASVPGAVKHDLGNGHFVATLAGHYLMFADRQQYLDRRKRNMVRRSEAVQYKMESREEEGGYRRDATSTGPMTVEELFEYEKSIGDEPSIEGARIER